MSCLARCPYFRGAKRKHSTNRNRLQTQELRNKHTVHVEDYLILPTLSFGLRIVIPSHMTSWYGFWESSLLMASLPLSWRDRNEMVNLYMC